MDYKILKSNVQSQADIKSLAERAEREDYHLYAGVSGADSWGHNGTEHYKLTADNAFMYEGELFAKTKHFVEPVTEATTADSVPVEEIVEQAADEVDAQALALENEALKARVAELEAELENYRKHADTIKAVEAYSLSQKAEASGEVEELRRQLDEIKHDIMLLNSKVN